MAIDIETTGFAYTDLIWQFGYVLVLAGEVAASSNVVLDIRDVWPRNAQPLADRISELTAQMAKNNAKCQLTMDVLSTGQDPDEVLEDISTLLTDTINGGYPVIAHNGLRFDFLRIDHRLKVAGFDPIPWRDNTRIDTDAMIRAPQMGAFGVPDKYETLEQWANRIKSKCVKGLNSKLGWCATEMGVVDADSLEKNAHAAEFDCFLIHGLMTKWQELERSQRVVNR